ncbi:hypothetical protein ADM99_04295 [Leptolinea tardivitalis]|uniref:Uncharacterized protein n=1 Tax=Leptolinea tardivitalis TaxID=229920 RepID=A0A0P6XE29_9CHLR|nr:hypothetical protein ADM99_04295 [Leptolinea tardivitalis]
MDFYRFPVPGLNVREPENKRRGARPCALQQGQDETIAERLSLPYQQICMNFYRFPGPGLNVREPENKRRGARPCAPTTGLFKPKIQAMGLNHIGI